MRKHGFGGRVARVPQIRFVFKEFAYVSLEFIILMWRFWERMQVDYKIGMLAYALWNHDILMEGYFVYLLKYFLCTSYRQAFGRYLTWCLVMMRSMSVKSDSLSENVFRILKEFILKKYFFLRYKAQLVTARWTDDLVKTAGSRWM